CFLIPIPLPPISTLFPYTTLFRSRNEHIKLVAGWSVAVLVGIHRWVDLRSRFPEGHISACCSQHVGLLGLRARLLDLLNGWPVPDRKSTRLNSSHVAISYAVFCLK